MAFRMRHDNHIPELNSSSCEITLFDSTGQTDRCVEYLQVTTDGLAAAQHFGEIHVKKKFYAYIIGHDRFTLHKIRETSSYGTLQTHVL